LRKGFGAAVRSVCSAFFRGALGDDGRRIFDIQSVLSQYDEKAKVLDEIELAVQINSKLRGRINVANGAPKEDIENAALGALGIERSAVK